MGGSEAGKSNLNDAVSTASRDLRYMSTIPNSELLGSEIPELGGWRSLGAVTGYAQKANALTLDCGEAKLRISFERQGIVRLRLAPTGIFGRDHSWAVVNDDTPAPVWKLDDENGQITLISSTQRVVIQKSPCRVSFHTLDGKLIAGHDPSKGIAWDGDEVRCSMRLHEDDHFFGLGERGNPLDKRGQVLVDWNHDAAEHDPWTDPLYQSHPFVIVLNAGRAHGIFFDNTFRATFDLGKTSTTRYSFGADGGELNYYFIPGPTVKDVVRRYAALVGTQSLPPLWALGYQQCRWSYETAKRVRELAKRLRKHRIPCDTIYLDIDYMDGFRCFTWDREAFPNPSKLLRELSDDGFKTVVIIDPGIKKEQGYGVYDSGIAGHHFCHDGSGRPYVGKVWPGESVYPDFTRAATRKWWGELYRGLLSDGVTGFWNDMNEPADFTFSHGTVPLTMRHDNDGCPTDHRECHNIYGMQMARASFEGAARLRENERPFVLTRAGYSGVQRYAAVWTGDNLSSWEHLRMSIPMLLNMGLSGVVFAGADIGGFRGHPSPELYARWLQLGIFYPLCRTHTCGGLTKDAPEQDPTSFGKKWIGINRKTIELRYRLMPYLYTQTHVAERTGLPVMRALVLEFPEMEKVHRIENEFMWGDQLLVAPVVEEGAKSRKLRLPSGDWFDFESGKHFEGGAEISTRVKIDSIPMFARAGAVVPIREAVQYIGERSLNELTLVIFPGNGRGLFYYDDGISYDYRGGEFVRESYAVEATAAGEDPDVGAARNCDAVFKFESREGHDTFLPATYLLAFRGRRQKPVSVETGDGPLKHLKKSGAAEARDIGWWHDRATRTVYVRIARPDAGSTVTLRQ